jgi:electron transfer flavoprotein alpha/beta subunit
VCRQALQASAIEAAITVRADKRLGTVATIRLGNAALRDAATDALARFPVAIEFD